MNQPVRKPGEGGKVTDSLSADDPSIPVLTERLTLPPLDLDLDFRLPPRPGQPAEPQTQPPEPRPVPLDDDRTRYAPLDDKTRFASADEKTRFASLDEQTRYMPSEPTHDDPASGARFGAAEADERTRIAPQARQTFAPSQFPSTPTPATRSPVQPPADEGPVTHGGSMLGADTLSGPATGTGVDSRFGVDTKMDVDSRLGADTQTDVDPRFGGDDVSGTESGPAFPAPQAADTAGGPQTVAPSSDAGDTGPRVPTSLLVSNLNTLLSTPTQTHRKPQPDDFDLTSTDSGQNSIQLDAELRERILLSLARQLPTEVDTIVRRHLETAIEEAVRRFTAEVRIALAGSLREIVDRAVKAELERIKTPRR